jgi:hypothetical protein
MDPRCEQVVQLLVASKSQDMQEVQAAYEALLTVVADQSWLGPVLHVCENPPEKSLKPLLSMLLVRMTACHQMELSDGERARLIDAFAQFLYSAEFQLPLKSIFCDQIWVLAALCGKDVDPPAVAGKLAMDMISLPVLQPVAMILFGHIFEDLDESCMPPEELIEAALGLLPRLLSRSDVETRLIALRFLERLFVKGGLIDVESTLRECGPICEQFLETCYSGNSALNTQTSSFFGVLREGIMACSNFVLEFFPNLPTIIRDRLTGDIDEGVL